MSYLFFSYIQTTKSTPETAPQYPNPLRLHYATSGYCKMVKLHETSPRRTIAPVIIYDGLGAFSLPPMLIKSMSLSNKSPPRRGAHGLEGCPFLPEVSVPPPRKMRFLISVQVSGPPYLSANHFPNMRVLVPKVRTPQPPKLSVMSVVFNVVSPISSYFASFFI
ncbi:hypothetical protein TNCT_669301 [Trichonephila clavata]|uniref:Uncharacterized protein n=1 Tax=Trichonephila clavata TaxID=2740835 RepID=A0A8X6KY64_TRICU|nr:hypothetical protein TNCT_669301 [Trichonephila clavata]